MVSSARSWNARLSTDDAITTCSKERGPYRSRKRRQDLVKGRWCPGMAESRQTTASRKMEQHHLRSCFLAYFSIWCRCIVVYVIRSTYFISRVDVPPRLAVSRESLVRELCTGAGLCSSNWASAVKAWLRAFWCAKKRCGSAMQGRSYAVLHADAPSNPKLLFRLHGVLTSD